jgi:geranylgeranyl pyrophosphate synthase
MAEKFGEMLGMAYQVQDDALDLVGDEVSLGKPVLTDLRGGKKSLVLIHCAARCSTKEKDFILSLLDRGGHYSTAEISKLRDLIESKGSLQYARERVEFYTNKAKEVLKRLDNGAATTRLFELTDYLASRYY